jgi:hypothetical protein
MLESEPKVRVFINGDILCEPIVDILPDSTRKDWSMVIFPDFNIFITPDEVLTTRGGQHYFQEDLKPGFYIWVNWQAFLARGDACMHWTNKVQRVPFVGRIEPPPIVN